jgi:apoptosis-inducing factor 3
MHQIKLCAVDAVSEGDPRQFSAEGTEVLIIKLNGEVFSLAARCTHAGAPLLEGELDGDVLICPWHGSHFRVKDGTVLKGPAEKPLKTYKTGIKEGFIFVEF